MTQTLLKRRPLKYVKLLKYGINITGSTNPPTNWALELWRDWYRANVSRSRPWV